MLQKEFILQKQLNSGLKQVYVFGFITILDYTFIYNKKLKMLFKLKQSLFSKNKGDNLQKISQPIEIKIKPKLISSEKIEAKRQIKTNKLIKSQPVLKQINEQADQKDDAFQIRSPQSPRFIRTLNQENSKNRQKVTFKYHSPPARNPVLIHQPVQPKNQQEKPAFRRQIIPPSDLVHDKMKNFDQNPEKFLLNIDQTLEKVFKKSLNSIIKNAEVVQVKDAQIRDSTDLLQGYKQK